MILKLGGGGGGGKSLIYIPKDPCFSLQCETEISFRLIAYTLLDPKPQTKQLREEVILVKKDISLKDNSVSHCSLINIYISLLFSILIEKSKDMDICVY